MAHVCRTHNLQQALPCSRTVVPCYLHQVSWIRYSSSSINWTRLSQSNIECLSKSQHVTFIFLLWAFICYIDFKFWLSMIFFLVIKGGVIQDVLYTRWICRALTFGCKHSFSINSKKLYEKKMYKCIFMPHVKNWNWIV